MPTPVDLGIPFPDGDLDPELAWLTDPTIWTAVPFGDVPPEMCRYFEGRVELAPTPAAPWTSCGPGCEETNLVPPFDTALCEMSTIVLEGKPQVVMIEQQGANSRSFSYPIHRVIRMRDATTTGLVMMQNEGSSGFAHCYMRGPSETASSFSARVWESDGQEIGERYYMRGAVPPFRPGDSWHWGTERLQRQEPPGTGMCGGERGETDARFLLVGAGQAWVLDGIDAPAWTLVQSPVGGEDCAGQGDLFVWLQPAAGGTKVHAWHPSSAPWIAGTLPSPGTSHPALSPTRFVALGWKDLAPYKEPRVLVMQRPTPASPSPTVQVSPLLAKSFDQLYRHRTWGKWSALVERPFGAPHKNQATTVLLDLDTLAAYRIKPPEGHGSIALGLDDRHLYVGEHDMVFSHTDECATVRRYELAHIGDFAEPIPSPGP